MPPETLKHVFDIHEAALLIAQFTQGKLLGDYLSDTLLRSAVERQFTILGEALSQALKADPSLANRISNARRICNFRNVLVHGYAVIKHDAVWGVIETDVPVLLNETRWILTDATSDGQT
jgi:uncharacterized protein with HEPN domain